VSHFAEHFLGPIEEDEYSEEAEDGGLGYYEDGVERTLTDEQIAIFRHSEIEALLRDRRHAEEAKEEEYESASVEYKGSTIVERQGESPAFDNIESMAEGDLEDGELEDHLSTSQPATTQPPQTQINKKNKRKKNKNAKKSDRPPQRKGFFKQNVKPDLRKRTWDKVDTGLDNLDYDEDTGSASVPNHAAQRRRISYDDE
jgi:hypothetical protein